MDHWGWESQTKMEMGLYLKDKLDWQMGFGQYLGWEMGFTIKDLYAMVTQNTSPRLGQNLYACAQPITGGVAAMDSCFGLVRPHHHGIARRMHVGISRPPPPKQTTQFFTCKFVPRIHLYLPHL